MVISPLLRGLFGLQTDALQHKVIFAPHVPADWTSFAIHNVRAGDTTLDFRYRKTLDEISLKIESSGASSLEFSPAVSPRARIISAELDGKRVPFQIWKSAVDQHVLIRIPVSAGKSTLRIRLRDDFALTFNNVLPYLGSRSQGLRFTSETWSDSRDSLSLELEGMSAAEYELAVWNPGQIASVEGAEVRNGKLVVRMSSNSHEAYTSQKIVIHFAGR
jgi:hypothetical protein